MKNTTLTIRLAVADDHQLFRAGIKMIFTEAAGIDVVLEAGNGQELLDSMKATLPDVILLDLDMPVLNGMDTMKALHQEYPDVKVIILTMVNNEEYLVHFMQSGASGYLLKDAHPTELVEAVRKVHNTGIYMNDHASKILLKRLEKVKTSPPSLKQGFDLVEREIEVLELICQEHTTQEIADKLFLSVRTIESYRKRLLEKTGARNTAGLVRFALENEMVAKTTIS